MIVAAGQEENEAGKRVEVNPFVHEPSVDVRGAADFIGASA
jgi:hypothetical protein